VFKHIRIVIAGFLFFLATSAFSFEIKRVETILVPYKGIIYKISLIFCEEDQKKICETYIKPDTPKIKYNFQEVIIKDIMHYDY
jgi:hypothetical protein